MYRLLLFEEALVVRVQFVCLSSKDIQTYIQLRTISVQT